MSEEEDLLHSLLAVATGQLEDLEETRNNKDEDASTPSKQPKTPQRVLIETDIFKVLSNHDSKTNSVVHNGDTDSSDDEGRRNCEDQKYSECGQEVKTLLKTYEASPSLSKTPKTRTSTWKTKHNLDQNPQDVFIDPVFFMRIVNPKISSAMLKEKMQGRLAIAFSDLAKQIFAGNLKERDWVICGALVNKSPPKTSQTGSQYSIWTLTDLKHDIKTVGLFMFRSAHKDLWKTTVGTVIGVLNPNIMERREGSKDEACLSVDSAQKVMIFGDSKDFGMCKSVKKNGDKCTAIVNLSNCEFCVYHIKQEYQKCSRRSELQSNFVGKGLVNLRNKVLGKNEVFYAGKSYMAIPAKKSQKLEAKDTNILQSLSGGAPKVRKSETKKNNKGVARHLDVNPAQRARDLELLKKLGGTSIETKTSFTGIQSNEVSLEDSKATALSVISKLKAKKESADNNKPITSKYDLRGDLFVNVEEKQTFSGKVSDDVSLEESKMTALSVISKLKAKKSEPEALKELENPENGKLTMGIPVLPGVKQGGFIDLNKPITTRHVDRAKMNALKYIQRNGPIKKIDPNTTKTSGTKKRSLENVSQESEEHPAKKSKLQESEFISDRFKKIMAKCSKHTDLLEQHDDEQREKYFRKLESKEKMEEKMTSTFKVKCKAVKCLKCKYTSFSASDLCKSERHPLKVFDAMKRFYKCSNCQNRTVTLDLVPMRPCNNCGSSKWEKTGMMKEKIAAVQHSLSIRGGEQKFINSVVTDASLDLLVPDDQ